MAHVLAAAVVVAAAVAGCAETEPGAAVPSKEPAPGQDPGSARVALDGDVVVDLEVVEVPDRRVRLTGTTNLPTGTILMLDVKENAQHGFYGQARTSVRLDGAFESELLGPKDGLEPGVYTASVTMPIPRVQPDHVQRIIGADGENLSGLLVESGVAGVTVSVDQEFIVGGAAASHLQQERVRTRIRQYRLWISKVVALNDRLQTARSDWLGDRTNHVNLARWGRYARQFRLDHAQLQSDLMDMPMSVRFTLGDPLEHVRRMFHATAFQKPGDYREASTQYAQSLEALEQFVVEAEGSGI